MEISQYASLLIYRFNRNTIEFLLVNDSFSNKRHWSPPRGKIIGQEDPLPCALREAINLTGLSHKDLILADTQSLTPAHLFKESPSSPSPSALRLEIKYLSGANRPKSVVHFLAQISPNAHIHPGGLAGLHFAWLPLQQACEKCVYKSMQDVLRHAHTFIEEKRPKSTSSPPARAPLASAGAGTGPASGGAMNSPTSSLPLNLQRLQLERSSRQDRGGDSHSPRRSERSVNSREHVFAPNGVHPKRTSQDERPTLPQSETRGGSGHAKQRSGKEPVHEADAPLYKTRLCERFEIEGNCPYGSHCTFAHGTIELRDRKTFGGETDKKEGPENPLYKTKMCERYLNDNFCQYGPRCNFAHSYGAPRTTVCDPDRLWHQWRPVSRSAHRRTASARAPRHT
ncbi:uncharacterized protein BJ171DRAFT_311248 [Polychytrium aggregatum]|uniref:uncharacterized protein n=1 Tax=Polychytrium aggregatum TaxID=110093 RepID=UPI0022FEAF0A|nr:uncharacterized protein BJ171DRAFT_311248 [Polychytrium aggregatum]KAI9207071.1 hypothetical protein BJ171DRAFT_311248 [Polychytrium aggregatum]